MKRNSMLTTWCGKTVFVFFLIITQTLLFAQTEKFPQDFQLYPRNTANNQAIVDIQGTIAQTAGYNQLRLKRFRNGQLQQVSAHTLIFVGGNANYRIQSQITAELANYRFELYGVKNNTEYLLKAAGNVVAGDAIIIQGQSNAVANWRGDFSETNDANLPAISPHREFVRVWGSAGDTWNKAWFIADGNSWLTVDGNTGQWGLRMASNLAGKHKVPICIFNGAQPNPISAFQRDDLNPTNPATNYGRLLQRTKEAGLQQAIRAILWHQGESDVAGPIGSQLTVQEYKDAYHQLQSDWKTDFPGVLQSYIFQIRLGCGMTSVDGCLDIQEAQRQIALEKPSHRIISTHNTRQLEDGGILDFCHYLLKDGYQVLGDRASDLLSRDLFGDKSLPNAIESPAPGKVWLSDFAAGGVARQLTLELKDLNSAYQAVGNLAANFRLEGGTYTIQSVTLKGNRVVIDFVRANGTAVNPKGLSFLSHTNTPAPSIYNEKNIGLISFRNVAVGPAPPLCVDRYENNAVFKPVQIKIRETVLSALHSSSDVDWYKFNASEKKNSEVKIRLYNMTGPCQIQVYDKKFKLLASATQAGWAEKNISFTPEKGSSKFYVQVSGGQPLQSGAACYSLWVEGDEPDGKNDDDDDKENWDKHQKDKDKDKDKKKDEANLVGMDMMEAGDPGHEDSRPMVYPVPARHELMLRYQSKQQGQLSARVLDLSGRQVSVRNFTVYRGPNLLKLDIRTQESGIYFLELRLGQERSMHKFIVEK